MNSLSQLSRILRGSGHFGTLCGAAILLPCSPALAQELEARRWSHLPIGLNLSHVTYAHTKGDIAFDPTLGIEDAEVEMDTALVGYARSFKLAGKSARIEVRQALLNGRWDGIVNGVPTTVKRRGLADTFVRLAVNFVGAPPLSGKDFGAYRAGHDIETIVGAAVSLQLPTGEYFDDKLINLGSNRFTIRPQLGVQHRRRNWTFEATAMAWIYTDNLSFFNGNELEQNPLYTLDGTVIYTMKAGPWVSASIGIGVGGSTRINGRANDDRKKDTGWAVGAGLPLSRTLGIKVNYVDSDRWNFVGNNSQTVSVGLSASWQ